MVSRYADHGIGLVMGSPLPDGTTFGALDIDRNEYVRVAKAMLSGDPPCGRFGSKGAVFFVRVAPGVTNRNSASAAKTLEKLLCPRKAVSARRSQGQRATSVSGRRCPMMAYSLAARRQLYRNA
jgi:hypothetical protein